MKILAMFWSRYVVETLVSLLILVPGKVSLSVSTKQLLQRVPGIWKLRTNSLPFLEPDIRAQLQGLLSASEPNSRSLELKNEILLKLNQDGTFKQCDEGYIEGKWISGNWKLIPDENGVAKAKSTKLILALNRQYFGPQYDCILDGCLNHNKDVSSATNTAEEMQLNQSTEKTTLLPLTSKGQVQIGKYLHPRGHTSFFDPPILARPEMMGPFSMEQTVASYSIIGDRLDQHRSSRTDHSQIRDNIENSDFYNKQFIMIVEPLKESKQRQQQTLHQPVDIRSLAVRFFSNNTFAATGSNKILGGRFYVEKKNKGNDSDNANDTFDYELSMQVSLFGAGRSAPGSVFSEGSGLTHEDERTYVGMIQQQFIDNISNGNSDNKKNTNSTSAANARLYMQGTVFYGTDLGEDARPEPVARFYSIEVTSSTKASIRKRLAGTTDDEDDTSLFAQMGGVFE